MPNVSSLDILLGDIQVGSLTLLGGDRSIFVFSDSYIEDEDRPTLSLSFKDEYGGVTADPKSIQTRIPNFFSNLLPEGQLREYLSERAGIKNVREFFLLWILGQDLPGNIIARPTDGEEWPPVGNEGLTDTEISQNQKYALRFSLAGVQLKFSAISEATGSLTIPDHGTGGSWITKLPSPRFDGVGENEYAMMKFAHLLGMDVPEVSLVSLDKIFGLPDGIGDIKGDAFAVERFDRTDTDKRIHIEDFAQVYDEKPHDKYKKATYANIASVLWQEAGEPAIMEYVRRIVYSALIGNGDMHLKNWSLIYRDGRNAELSPAYDFVSTIPYIKDDKAALNLFRGGSKTYDDFTTDALVRFAAKALLPKSLVLDTARETVEKFLELWPQAKEDFMIEKRVIDAIETHLKTLPIAQFK